MSSRDTNLKEKSIDYINCDQVIHHTEDPTSTLNEFNRILKNSKEIALYVYAKKALPRELLDDHFRELTKKTSKKDMWDFSKQITALGKTLSDLNTMVTAGANRIGTSSAIAILDELKNG